MINFCLYLVACVGMMSVRGSDDTCDSRIGYLIFLKGFKFQFCRDVAHPVLSYKGIDAPARGRTISSSSLKSLKLPTFSYYTYLNLLLLYWGVCLRAVCRIKGNKQIVCSYCKLRNSSYIYFSSSLRASYIPQDLPRTHSAKSKCPYIL